MRLAFFELEEWEEKWLKDNFSKKEIICFKEKLEKRHLSKIKNVDAIGVFIYSNVNKEIIDNLPNLKLVLTLSTGYEHIDKEYCKRKGITICNVPSYGENTVAEHAFSLLLSLSRKIYPSIKRTHEEHSFETDSTLRGFDLKEKNIGIIGYGHIGKKMVKISNGFDMNVLVYDRHPDKKAEKEFNFKYVDLDYLLKNSDIISLHLPLVKETEHIIDKKAFNKMKKGVVLINTARGGLIDTHSLIEALKSGKVLAAGLDVLEEECEILEERELLTKQFKNLCNLNTLLEDHLLMSMNNVIITPHNAFNSKEALERILRTTLESIESFKKGKPVNTVN